MIGYSGAERLEGRFLFAAGDLDPTFGGGDGMADLVGAGRVHAIGFTGDSSIVVVGSTPIPPFGSGGQGLKLRLVRYRPDGALDTSFGVGGNDGDGVVTVDDVTANGGSTVMAFDPTGRIVVAVEGTILVRFSADGKFDTTFGENGKAWAYFGHPSTPNAVFFGADGKIVVSAHVTAPDGSWEGSARFNPDGTPDTSYGFGGTTIGAAIFGGSGERIGFVGAYDTRVPDEFASGVKSATVQDPPLASATDAGGSTFALDYAITDDGRSHLALLGFKSDGSLDPTFAHAVHSSFAAMPALIALQPGTGRILFGSGGEDSFRIYAAQSSPPLDAPRPVPGLDATPPTAELIAVPDVTAATVSPLSFVVRYADDVGLRDSSFDSSDVRVTAPDGSSLLAQFAGVTPDGTGSARLATYLYTPPGGGFTAAMDGAYTVSVEPGQAFDAAGNAVVAGHVGTFSVNIPADAPNLAAGTVTSRLGRAGTVVAAARPRGAVSFIVTNTGTRRFAGAVAFSVVASTDSVLDANDVEVAAATRRLVLRRNGTRRIALRPHQVPGGLQEGDYHLLARVDATGAVAETSETDNVSVSPSPALHVVAAGTSPRRKRETLFGVEPVLPD